MNPIFWMAKNPAFSLAVILFGIRLVVGVLDGGIFKHHALLYCEMGMDLVFLGIGLFVVASMNDTSTFSAGKYKEVRPFAILFFSAVFLLIAVICAALTRHVRLRVAAANGGDSAKPLLPEYFEKRLKKVPVLALGLLCLGIGFYAVIVSGSML